MHFRRQLKPFQMPENPSVEDIHCWLALDNDAPVSLWTMQQPGAVVELYNIGELRGNREYAFQSLPMSYAKQQSYYFAMRQARKLMPHDWSELPVWASFHKINESRYQNDTTLKLIVPKSRIFPSVYNLWSELLNISPVTEGREWPKFWPLVSPFINLSQDHAGDNAGVFSGSCDVVMPSPSPPSEAECRKSWESVFDVRVTLRPSYKRSRTLQVMLPYISIVDIESAEEALQLESYR